MWHIGPPQTIQAAQMIGVWQVFVYAGIAVYAIVAGLIIYAAVAYRCRDRSVRQASATFHKNSKLEIIWTVIPVLIVAGLFVKTYIVEAAVETVHAHPAEIVDVVAYRWSWRFTYPREHIVVDGTPDGPPTLVLPVGQTTRINLTSSDVVHAFWIPAFVFKRDANPGMVNVFEFKPTAVGTHLGRCAEYCGTYHANMGFTVRVVSRRDFDLWVQSQPKSSST